MDDVEKDVPLVEEKEVQKAEWQSSAKNKNQEDQGLTKRSRHDQMIIGGLILLQLVTDYFLFTAHSLGAMALVTTVGNSLCQALIDFYEHKKGKPILSAGIRVASVVSVLGIYYLSAHFGLGMVDKF